MSPYDQAHRGPFIAPLRLLGPDHPSKAVAAQAVKGAAVALGRAARARLAQRQRGSRGRGRTDRQRREIFVEGARCLGRTPALGEARDLEDAHDAVKRYRHHVVRVLKVTDRKSTRLNSSHLVISYA